MTTQTKVATVTQSYRQTVQSKYLPDSGRVKVTASGGFGKYYNWNASLDTAENHANAIESFLNFMEWEGHWQIGSTTSGTGYVAVWVGHGKD